MVYAYRGFFRKKSLYVNHEDGICEQKILSSLLSINVLQNEIPNTFTTTYNHLQYCIRKKYS